MRANRVLVQGMQFGSEGKGQISGMIAHRWAATAAVCANHPNAGHTYRDPQDNKFIHRILPVGAAVPSVHSILIGPGAVIDMEALESELTVLKTLGLLDGKTLYIHPNACIVLPQHVEAEKRLVKIGSTMKGSMEATYHKIRREVNTANTVSTAWFALGDRIDRLVSVVIDQKEYDDTISSTPRLVIEGAQGFSLGVHEMFYPYCTSRDVSTAQALADCRVPVDTNRLHVVGVARTYPIRVANRFDTQGNMVGTSGGFYEDQKEIGWNSIGRKPELTTVTKLPRRIFTLSMRQLHDAARVMRPDTIALTFCDYMTEDGGEEGNGKRIHLPAPVRELGFNIEHRVPTDTWVRLFSFGPKFEDTYSATAMHSLHEPHLDFI